MNELNISDWKTGKHSLSIPSSRHFSMYLLYFSPCMQKIKLDCLNIYDFYFILWSKHMTEGWDADRATVTLFSSSIENFCKTKFKRLLKSSIFFHFIDFHKYLIIFNFKISQKCKYITFFCSSYTLNSDRGVYNQNVLLHDVWNRIVVFLILLCTLQGVHISYISIIVYMQYSMWYT